MAWNHVLSCHGVAASTSFSFGFILPAPMDIETQRWYISKTKLANSNLPWVLSGLLREGWTNLLNSSFYGDQIQRPTACTSRISLFGNLLRQPAPPGLLSHITYCGTMGFPKETLAQDGQLIGWFVTCSPTACLLCVLPPVTRVDRKHCAGESLLAVKPLFTREAGQGWDTVLAQVLEGRGLAWLSVFLLLQIQD